MMICEIQKRAGSAPFLAHEQHRRIGAKQEECGSRSITCWRDRLMQPIATRAISNLVMIRNAVDKMLGRDVIAWCPTRDRILLEFTGKKPSDALRLKQLLHGSFEVPHVAFIFARHLDSHDVVKIIGPYSVASVPAFISWQDDFPFVTRIFTDHESSKSLDPFSDLLDQMLRRIVGNCLRRIEPKPINVELFYPIDRILSEMISNRL